MAIFAKIIADSINFYGSRLITVELRYHRFIHSELMTHRLLSRNAASSRAIPIEKVIEQVLTDPAIPAHWGSAQKGMGAEYELSESEQEEALFLWLQARDSAVAEAKKMLKLGLAKQVVNRILEPFVWMTTIVGATEWTNFFRLRAHPAAQPEFRILAELILEAVNASQPKSLSHGEWHLPFASEIEAQNPQFSVLSEMEQVKVCTAVCGRVSYSNHGKDYPLDDSIEWTNKRTSAGHWSVAEFCARSMGDRKFYGNYMGWKQFRYTFENQHFDTDDRLKLFTFNKVCGLADETTIF